MIKKNVIIFSLIFILSNCGFTPIYLNNTNVNFSIEKIIYVGDRELNNFLNSNLNKYKNEKTNNKIFIEANTKFEKIILSKDETGKATNYQLIAEVEFLIKQTNKKFIFTEKRNMERMDDKFEETSYERSVKESFASSISNKLISKLIIN